MTENLLTPSVIKLFGRLLSDLKFSYDSNTVVTGYNNLLQRQLINGGVAGNATVTITGTTNTASNVITNVSSISGLTPGMSVSAISARSPVFSAATVITTIPAGSNSFVVSANPLLAVNNISIQAVYNQSPNLARIYGFSFEGAYYGLPRPSIFLVHGLGSQVGSWPYPSTVEQSGVAAREWDFSGPTGFVPNQPANPPLPPNPNDLWYWEYEKGDFSIRFDTEAGPFEQILLVAMLRAGADMADRATPRSGASLSGASLSGASLAGASLSGASLSGASLSGASLSGASLRGR
jgi:Pentapeptide repeats (8 copies)